MTNPLPKHVKIGSIWQDIVYENLPMMCYRCGRIGYQEPQCSEAMVEPTNLPSQELEQRNPAAPPLDPNHMSSPWKTVHTRRTRARGRPNESPHRGKTDHADSYPPSHACGPPSSPHDHRNRYHHFGSMTRQGRENGIKPAGLHCGEVATQDATDQMLLPRENGQECMHTPCQAGCPSLRSQLSDVPLVGLHAPCMANCPHPLNPLSHEHGMQQAMKLNVPHSKPTPLALTSHNGPVLGPTLFHNHPDGPQPEAITHSPKFPHHPTTSTMNSQAPSLQDHDLVMANLKQIWSSLSLEHSHDKTVSFV